MMVAPFNEVEGQRKKEDSLRFEYVKKEPSGGQIQIGSSRSNLCWRFTFRSSQ